MVAPRLIGDIGATYSRFAIEHEGRIDRLEVLQTSRHENLRAAIEHYLGGPNLRGNQRPIEAALAVAGPVSGDQVVMTNIGWSFSENQLQEELNLQVKIYNDFAAVARALPALEKDDLLPVGEDRHVRESPIAVIGPGTGLGVAGLVRTGDDWFQIPGEGGHATMPAVTREESKIVDLLRLRWDHISAERILSGDGLVNLYRALCTLHGAVAPNFSTAAEITGAAIPDSERIPPNWLCLRTFEVFCAMLGTFAADVALTFGAARVYIAGGILRRFSKQFADSPFRTRFEQKGRLSSYVASIPTYLVLHEAPALVGLIKLMQSS